MRNVLSQIVPGRTKGQDRGRFDTETNADPGGGRHRNHRKGGVVVRSLYIEPKSLVHSAGGGQHSRLRYTVMYKPLFVMASIYQINIMESFHFSNKYRSSVLEYLVRHGPNFSGPP